MILESLIVSKITFVVAIFNSIVFQISFVRTSLLKLLYTLIFKCFQNLLIFLELNKTIYITKISRNKFIILKTFPTTVY